MNLLPGYRLKLFEQLVMFNCILHLSFSIALHISRALSDYCYLCVQYDAIFWTFQVLLLRYSSILLQCKIDTHCLERTMINQESTAQ